MASSKSTDAGSGRSSTPISLSASIPSSSSSSSLPKNNPTVDRDPPNADGAERNKTDPTIQLVASSLDEALSPQPEATITTPTHGPPELTTPTHGPPEPPSTDKRVVDTPVDKAGPKASSEPALMTSLTTAVLRKKTATTKQTRQSKLHRLSSFFPSLISLSSADSAPVPRKPVPADSPIQEKGVISVTESGSPTQKTRQGGAKGSHVLGPDANHAHQEQLSLDQEAMGKLQKQISPPMPDMPPPPPPPPQMPQTPDTTPSRSSTFQFTETKPSPKLTKRQPSQQRPRSSSVQESHHIQIPSPRPSTSRGLSPSPTEPRGRSVSAQPPMVNNHNHNVSATDSRPGSSSGSQSPTREHEKRGRLRRSWFAGGRSRSNSQDMRSASTSTAWTLGPNKADYNTAFLEKGERVPELWNESGTVVVYLHSKESGLGPSFKVMSFVTDFSLAFIDLIEAEMNSATGAGRQRSYTGRDSLSAADADRRIPSPPDSPPASFDQYSGESKLYIPTVVGAQPGSSATPDLERLISIRNMFALLTGQPLVGTKTQPTLFVVLSRVADLFSEFEFTSMDGTTFGDAVNMSFGFFMEQHAVGDVRHSREKTLEALILGERLKSWDLYNEAFAHAAGKYSALRDLNSPLWDQLSTHTRQRLERAHLELVTRQNTVNNRLENFEFPALFSGIANSATQYKGVKFGRWRSSFHRMRSFVLGYYKNSFGSWPPKARSKKNPFTESGLNRLVLKILYSDLCALYDLIVDRRSLTTRSFSEDNADDDESAPSAMRRILTEFDQSTPPVLPPIPYDLPTLPDFTSVKENYYSLSAKEQKRLDSNYQDYEFLLILSKSYDFETLRLKLPFLEQFKEFEEKEARGKPISEIADMRYGYWLFLYVVIQSLPMLVVDAPGLSFTEGVEYFLCQPPKGHPPWVGEGEVRKRWYEISGGAGYVELSEDTIEFSIEGIYHRSHCWVAAKQWEAGMHGPLAEPQGELPPLEPPHSVFADMDPLGSQRPRSESPTTSMRPRGASPSGSRAGYRSSVALGLEPVPMPSESRAGYRSSVALGLEPVAMPGESPYDSLRSSRVFSMRDGSLGPRSSVLMRRSRSYGNLIEGSDSPTSESRSSSRLEVPSGSTFDDILKDMDKKPKKKKFFG